MLYFGDTATLKCLYFNLMLLHVQFDSCCNNASVDGPLLPHCLKDAASFDLCAFCLLFFRDAFTAKNVTTKTHKEDFIPHPD